MKVNECNDLKMQNRALMEENARFRSLAEKLLGHAAFRPFLEELSHDPEIAQSLNSVANGSSATPTPQQTKKDVDPFNFNSQQFLSPTQNQHVGMVLMPEPQIDLSSLNLGGNNWGMPSMGMNNFQQPQVSPARAKILSSKSSPVNTTAQLRSRLQVCPRTSQSSKLPKASLMMRASPMSANSMRTTLPSLSSPPAVPHLR